jgi:ribonuclease D
VEGVVRRYCMVDTNADSDNDSNVCLYVLPCSCFSLSLRLCQLSCRDKDYIVDVLALRQHMDVLLPLFADPDVVKVFHGCDKDILWLQRDLGLYVVNCFDTYQAAKALRYPALSLAHLLKYYCGVTLNKKYQLADWRERPLPPHLIEYAKLDTHYLLYVYDCLRRDVHAGHGSSGIEAVYEASRRTCLQRYEKDSFYPLGYLKLVNPRASEDQQVANNLSFEQNAVMSCLWNWRDLTARRTDESCGYIMSNAELLRIGKAAPSDASALVATGPLSEYVREHLEEVASVIQEQLQGGAGGSSSGADVSAVGGVSTSAADEEQFMLSLSSPARASKKRSSFEVGMGGSRHQLGRMQGYSTVTEFTPRLPPVPALSSFHAPASGAAAAGGASGAAGSSEAENVHRNFQNIMDTDPDWKKKVMNNMLVGLLC